MTKILKVKFPDRCNGCEMCVLEVQRQLQKVGLEGSLIRIFADRGENNETSFTIELDPRITNMNIQKIKDICPQDVYEITEEENAGLIK
ncbi:hypothetical protein GYA27_02320 [candidate division WWE3 bacterium]|uniref:Uncharacterized protein n=1 Tax=candidate division WWE3 bacterium TaxID=2053526 RepID=A0A7X9HGV8_UNCKA|nr:hypothetical protein [candidate division WWE3 bacterium]